MFFCTFIGKKYMKIVSLKSHHKHPMNNILILNYKVYIFFYILVAYFKKHNLKNKEKTTDSYKILFPQSKKNQHCIWKENRIINMIYT